MAAKPSNDDKAETDVESIPVVDETATVSKRWISAGKVRVSTIAEDRQEDVDATLESDVVDVVRVAIDRVVDHSPEIRTEGDVTIVPVLEEVIFVEKKLVLKEELHIRRRSETETVHVPITLRRQRVVVENLDAAGNAVQEEGHKNGL